MKNYDIAIQFDGDGQHNVECVKKITKNITNGQADLVIGSRFIEKNGDNFRTTRSRRLGIKIRSWLMKIVTGTKIYDTTSGFRACNKRVIAYFAKSYPTEYPEPITTVELLKRKCKIKEVAVKMRERTGGKSSIYSWKSIYYMINVML